MTDRTPGDAADRPGVAPGDADGDDRDVPFAALSADLAERERRRSAGDDADDPFEAVAVPEFDGDAWAALEGTGEADAGGTLGGEAIRVGGAADDRPEHVVSKREYCQRCPHVSDPPALACTHEGGEIAEVLDDGLLRVRGCPMVDGTDVRRE